MIGDDYVRLATRQKKIKNKKLFLTFVKRCRRHQNIRIRDFVLETNPNTV